MTSSRWGFCVSLAAVLQAGKDSSVWVLRPTTQADGVITLSFIHPNNGSVQHSLIYRQDGGFTFGDKFGCPVAPNMIKLLEWQKLTV